MTANEMADLLIIVDALQGNVALTEAATMLRQQHAEIEALKLCCPKCGGVTGKLEVLNVPAKTLTDEEIDEIEQLKALAISLNHRNANLIYTKQELALQRLSDIGQEFESFDRTASHMADEYVSHPDELQTLVKSFFEDYLDVQEESDGGRVFNPIHISCVRAMKVEPMAKLLIRIRELSGAKE